MSFLNNSYAQLLDKKARDTIYVNDDSFEELAKYGAKDSIYLDVKENKIHLYGEAHLEYLETNMKAGYILVDLKKNEVFASYILTKDSNKIEMPQFKNGAEEIQASRIRYNFKTQKGYIEEVKIKQDEIFLYMGVAKRQHNGDIHFKQGRFTTCELDDPHYHFNLSKAVMIPDKRIVTGPMNLWIKGVPTPFGLPFSIIPQAKERTHGLLFPQIIPMSALGFGVNDLGYFFPINKSLHTSAFITLYNRGSWGVKNTTDYFTLYKRKGSFNIDFQQMKQGFPSTKDNNKLSVSWDHLKDPKSNPFWVFSTKVNYISDNNAKTSLYPQNVQYFNNQLNSDINLQRLFPGKPLTMGLKIGLKQSTQTKNISLTSPIYNVNLTRIFPFKKFIHGDQEWKKVFSSLSFAYTGEIQNKSTFKDTLLTQHNYSQIQNQFLNGVSQNMTIQTTAGLFKNTWKFNPSVTYSNRINFQQIEKNYVVDSVVTNLTQKTGYSHDLSFNASLTTVVYSYYRFIGKSKPLLRHILTPTFGFKFIPNLNTFSTLDTGTVAIKTIRYSPFEQSVYSSNPTNSAGLITFGINNTFELKRKSEKDTLTGFKKTNIIDALSINGNYDVLKDSMKLSTIAINVRISPAKSISFVASSNYSPYAWDSKTGMDIGKYALNSSGKLGRLLSTNLNTSYVVTSKVSREKLEEVSKKSGTNWNTDYTYFSLYPERVVNFEIPWKITFTHIYSINANTTKTASNSNNFRQVQTISTNGDLSFTKRWKIIGTVNFDVQTVKITYTTLTLTRDMHCWNLSFNWIPIGQNQSFLFSLRSTSSMFKDAKFDLRKPPLFF